MVGSHKLCFISREPSVRPSARRRRGIKGTEEGRAEGWKGEGKKGRGVERKGGREGGGRRDERRREAGDEEKDRK